MRIAIVEDHVLIAKQLVALVTLAGHQAVAASNGTLSSIEPLIASKPELAFVDISILGSNAGLEIAKRLIREHDIPIVFVTANRRRLPVNFCNAIGVIDKPFRSLSFEKALSYIVARLNHAATTPPLPASLILSPLFRTLWNRGLAIQTPKRDWTRDVVAAGAQGSVTEQSRPSDLALDELAQRGAAILREALGPAAPMPAG